MRVSTPLPRRHRKSFQEHVCNTINSGKDIMMTVSNTILYKTEN
jgi:hypothetical protein